MNEFWPTVTGRSEPRSHESAAEVAGDHAGGDGGEYKEDGREERDEERAALRALGLAAAHPLAPAVCALARPVSVARSRFRCRWAGGAQGLRARSGGGLPAALVDPFGPQAPMNGQADGGLLEATCGRGRPRPER